MQQIDTLNSLLNTSLDDVPTSMPLLKGLADLECVEAKVVEKDGKSSAQFAFALQTGMTAIDGRTVNPGFKVYHNISLTPTEKYPLERIKESLAKFREGVLGTKSGSFAPVEQYIGAKPMAQLAPQLSEQYGDKTVISRFVKKA